MRKILGGLLLALGTLGAAAGGRAAEPPRYNVLFIAVDDLRPQLGCYGNTVVKSPNIDRLAARGTVFNRAYCQQAVCSPSRTSLMTGRRPDTTKVYDLVTHFRKNIPDAVTVAEHFKSHGYHSQGIGKIYHGGYDDPQSWTVPHSTPRVPRMGPEGRALVRRLTEEARAAGVDLTNQRNHPRGLPWEAPEVGDSELQDGAIGDRGVELLSELKEKPFFLAVGFMNPHLPFVAPKKYWDLYREEQLRPASNPNPPQDAPAFAGTTWGELRQYHGIPKQGPLSPEQTKKMLHGYHAAVSYMDAQVGKLLDALDRLGLREKTVVVLWGDHGWQLGEHGFWCKHTNYEVAARAPLIMSVPGQKAAGKKTDGLVEFVDIYPTLADVCRLPLPQGLEGTSFKALLDQPGRKWKTAAFSQYPRGVPGTGRVMGYSMRTDRYRFVEWSTPQGKVVEQELYDHQSDPDENVNLAKQPEKAELVRKLSDQLRAGWRSAVPGAG